VIVAALFGAVVIAAVLVLVRARRRGWSPAPVWRSGLRLGALFAVARLSLLWTTFLWADEASDWRQVARYAALVFNAVVELVLVRAWRGDPDIWRVLLTVLVLLTSLGLGLLVAYLADRMQAPSRWAARSPARADCE